MKEVVKLSSGTGFRSWPNQLLELASLTILQAFSPIGPASRKEIVKLPKTSFSSAPSPLRGKSTQLHGLPTS